MSFTVKKVNGELIFTDNGGYESRNPSTMWCIRQADAVYKWPDFTEIKLVTDDYENADTDYTYSKQNSFNRLIPDFTFHAWPETGLTDYNTFVDAISAAGLQPAIKNCVGWIGNPNTNVRRNLLLQIGGAHPDMFELTGMRWRGGPQGQQMNATRYISTPDLVQTYAVLLDIEGVGFSARLKHLLWSHRPVLLVDRPHKEFFFQYLKEWIHYIPVKRDLSDLVEITRWTFDNYEKACVIANNAYEFCQKYLTRDACYKQWDSVIMGRPADY